MKGNFDVILFDLDGTLTDSSEGITKSVQYALSKVGIDETDLKKLECFIGPPLPDSFMKYYGFSKEEAVQLRFIYNERYGPIGWKENKPYDGIIGTLEALKNTGKILGVATSKPEVSAIKVLDLFDMRKYFKVLSAGSNDGLKCEKSDSIRNAIERLKEQGVQAQNPVLVGDTRFDVEGAHKCGIPCIGVTWGFAKEGEFEACGAEYVVDTMEQLLEILK